MSNKTNPRRQDTKRTETGPRKEVPRNQTQEANTMSDMSTTKMEDIMKEANQELSVLMDLLEQDGTKARAEQAIQLLISHAKNTLLAAKKIAVPHRIEFSFLNVTLRYPENSAAGYAPEDLKRMKASDDPWERNEAKAIERTEPKLLGDAIWNSSENCSDQGLSLFNYDDFTTDGGW